MTLEEFTHAHRNDFDLYQASSGANLVSHKPGNTNDSSSLDKDEDSEDESLSVTDNDEERNFEKENDTDTDHMQESLSLGEFYENYYYGSNNQQQDHNLVPSNLTLPVIRLVEMDGVMGTVGIVVPDPARSPVEDNVFGIRFVDNQGDDDDTEEFSDISNYEERGERGMLGSGRHSPATEDEMVSDLETDAAANPHPPKVP